MKACYPQGTGTWTTTAPDGGSNSTHTNQGSPPGAISTKRVLLFLSTVLSTIWIWSGPRSVLSCPAISYCVSLMPYFVKHKIISSFKSNHFASMTSFQFDCNPQVPGLRSGHVKSDRLLLVDQKSKITRNKGHRICVCVLALPLPLIYGIYMYEYNRIDVHKSIYLPGYRANEQYIYSCCLCYPNYLLLACDWSGRTLSGFLDAIFKWTWTRRSSSYLRFELSSKPIHIHIHIQPQPAPCLRGSFPTTP